MLKLREPDSELPDPLELPDAELDPEPESESLGEPLPDPTTDGQSTRFPSRSTQTTGATMFPPLGLPVPPVVGSPPPMGSPTGMDFALICFFFFFIDPAKNDV